MTGYYALFIRNAIRERKPRNTRNKIIAKAKDHFMVSRPPAFMLPLYHCVCLEVH